MCEVGTFVTENNKFKRKQTKTTLFASRGWDSSSSQISSAKAVTRLAAAAAVATFHRRQRCFVHRRSPAAVTAGRLVANAADVGVPPVVL